jgi:DNA-binding phage protein
VIVMSEKRPAPKVELTPEQQARVAAVREKLKHKPPLEEVCTEQELADAVSGADYSMLRGLMLALRKERERQGRSLAKVAEQAGIAPETLSRLETGNQTNPTFKTLCLLARALGKQLALSLCGTEAPGDSAR